MSESMMPPMGGPQPNPAAPPGLPPGAKPIQGNPNQTVGGIPNRLVDGPIPGQSLTRTPGQYPFENPPQFADLDDAMEAIMKSLQTKDHLTQLLNLMEMGVPLKALVGTIVFSGFMEGKWNPDVAMLLVKPLTSMLIRIAQEAGIKPESGIAPKTDPTLDKVVEKRLKEMAANPPVPESKGLMAPPKKGK